MPLYIDRRGLGLLVQANSLAFMIGGYDGNHNFGDILQMIGALNTLTPFKPHLTPAVIIEQNCLVSHRQVLSAWEDSLDGVAFIFFGDHECELPDGLIPLPHLANPTVNILYAYGGCYFNRRLGDRKQTMISSLYAWLADSNTDASKIVSLITGVQVDEWILSQTKCGAWLDHSLLLRCRDVDSANILKKRLQHVDLGPDDAMPPLLKATQVKNIKQSDESPIRIGVHLNIPSYSVQDGNAQSGLLSSLLQDLHTTQSKGIVVVPIYYDEDEVLESKYFEALFAQLHHLDIAIDHAINLGFGKSVDKLASLDSLLCCSYHIAMSACLSGVRTVLIVSNEYYAQKLNALRQWFDNSILACLKISPESSLDPCLVNLGKFLVSGIGISLPTEETRSEIRQQTEEHVSIITEVIRSVLLNGMADLVSEISRAYTHASAEVSRLRSLNSTFLNSADKSLRTLQEQNESIKALQKANMELTSRFPEINRLYRKYLNRSGWKLGSKLLWHTTLTSLRRVFMIKRVQR
ncbi:MAG: hypothetical protein ACP5SH_23960 [Syntrophobacteraceae bacterium]